MVHNQFAGMTTNERLLAADLLASFDGAVRRRDREGMIAILQRVELGDQAEKITDSILTGAKTYGY